MTSFGWLVVERSSNSCNSVRVPDHLHGAFCDIPFFVCSVRNCRSFFVYIGRKHDRHQDANNVDSAGFRGSTISMLYCAANVTGSETLFAHCHTMWKRLTPSQRAFLQSSEAVHSNRSTAGGPAAVDSAFGLRMNASGTKRIRDATRRRRCDIILRSLCNSRREVTLSCPCPDHTGTNV